VAQRTYEWQQHQVLDWSYDALREFLARRWLDAPTLERLRALLQERQTIARNTEEIGNLQAERDQLYQREEHLRKNLAALSSTGEEATLRQQVFAQLGRSEARLEAIDGRITALQEENKQRQASLDAALGTLNVPDATAAAGG
jgi:hypothetical protein